MSSRQPVVFGSGNLSSLMPWLGQQKKAKRKKEQALRYPYLASCAAACDDPYYVNILNSAARNGKFPSTSITYSDGLIIWKRRTKVEQLNFPMDDPAMASWLICQFICKNAAIAPSAEMIIERGEQPAEWSAVNGIPNKIALVNQFIDSLQLEGQERTQLGNLLRCAVCTGALDRSDVVMLDGYIYTINRLRQEDNGEFTLSPAAKKTAAHKKAKPSTLECYSNWLLSSQTARQAGDDGGQSSGDED